MLIYVVVIQDSPEAMQPLSILPSPSLCRRRRGVIAGGHALQKPRSTALRLGEVLLQPVLPIEPGERWRRHQEIPASPRPEFL
jgi:hypothetical protein